MKNGFSSIDHGPRTRTKELRWNLYTYAGNNPMNYTDPEGTMAKLQGLGKAVDPYPLNYSFPLSTGYISPAELSAYYSIALSIALEVEYENYKIKYADAVSQFISLLQEHIKNRGEIFNILYNIFERANFGLVVKEVLTQILKMDNKYIQYGTRECLGTECKVGVVHYLAIALAHTHPNKSLSGQTISPIPSKGFKINGKVKGDIRTAKEIGLPNITVSKEQIWVAFPDGSIHKVLEGIWWSK